MIKNINRHVIPECYLDTNLVETLVPPTEIGRIRIYNHQFGCNTVAKEMKEKFSDNFAVGIIDLDKIQPKYISEFNVPLVNKLGLKFFKHPQKSHYLIIHPPLEQWLLDEAKQVGINLNNAAYNLPVTLGELKIESKRELAKKDPRFKCLFRDLKKQEATGINLLAKWIEYLKTNPYTADSAVLQNL